MTDTTRISIESLRSAAIKPSSGTSSWVPPVGVRRSSLLALVEAVEAAHDLIDRTETDLLEIGRRELRLSQLLRQFDFGGQR